MFTHLHVHTEYSLLDGMCRLAELPRRAKELGMDSVAITDHGVMYGAVDFFKACEKEGVKPIIGCEVYTTADRFDRAPRGESETNHLVLLCKNEEGYRNLIQIVSEGFLEGFYYKPRVDYDTLRRFNGGLIALSACLAGAIPRALLRGDMDGAKKIVAEMKSLFEDFYIELQDHGIDEQKQILPLLVQLARETDTPMVATNDAHYLTREDAKNQDVLMCIQTGKTLDEENRMRFSTEEFYLKSEEEMAALFPFAPEAITNTCLVADKCNFAFTFGERHLPTFDVPSGMTARDYLRALCEKGLVERYGTPTEEQRTRLDYELSVIESMGFLDYFLIVWDFVRFAKDHSIPVGPGRGSAAGSIVSYCLRITDVDPLRYQLIFERFLNPERVSMPDIDIDFCPRGRGDVINYVIEKYGARNVSQIGTFGTLKARGAIRDCGRVLGMAYGDVDVVAKMVPNELGMTITQALENPPLKEAYAADSATALLIDTARAIEGLPRNIGTHAAGVVIASQPISTYLPIQRSDDIISTQYTKDTVEELGLLKMDFLGLRNLTIIDDCVRAVAELGETIDLTKIDECVPAVYEMIARGDTDGVFQLESEGMRNFMKRLEPTCMEDIIAGIALYRPGPMDFIPQYIRNKHNPANVTYKHPMLEPILDVTYGCIVYQEQVMQIVRDLAGFSLGRSDEVRRAMSKKKAKDMEKARQSFIYGELDENGEVRFPGCIRNGIDEATAIAIFHDMDAFAQYAFNKSHAAAYAVVTYQTAYLKSLYPEAFMAALLTSVMGDGDKIPIYINQCSKMGIKILPPDINKSKNTFTAEHGAIRFGLSTIKNVGDTFVRACVEEREASGPFRGLRDFASRMASRDLNKRAVEGLVKAGAFDSVPGTRAQKLAYYEVALEGASRSEKTNLAGQISFFTQEEDLRDNLPASCREYTARELLTLEKEAAGLYLSGHPLDEYRAKLETMQLTTCAALLPDAENSVRVKDQSVVQMAGIVTARREKLTRNQAMMAFLTIEDLTGSVEVVVFPKTLARLDALLREDAVLVVQGRVDLKEDETAKLLLETAAPLTNTVAALSITLREEQVARLDELRRLLLEHRGGDAITLHIGTRTIAVDSSICCRADEALVDKINKLFGCVAATIG